VFRRAGPTWSGLIRGTVEASWTLSGDWSIRDRGDHHLPGVAAVGSSRSSRLAFHGAHTGERRGMKAIASAVSA